MQQQSSVEIDESLYSRQLYVMGHEAQARMASSSVLIAGLSGLGVEVAKNVILAGVKSVTLYDNQSCSWDDLSSQFYLSESDIGQNRATVSAAKLTELNPYVHVSLASSNESVLSIIHHNNEGKGEAGTTTANRFNVVVLIDFPLSVQLEVSEYCHTHGIAVIIGDAKGVCGQIFCDFGNSFVVNDSNGEPAATALLAGITKDVRGLVTVLEETRHNLNTGDVIILNDIIGMTELNGVTCTVEVKDPFSFEIDIDTSSYHTYERSGYLTQIKQPTTHSFKRFSESLKSPGEFTCDFNKLMKCPILHFCFLTLHEYRSQSKDGSHPSPGNTDHAQSFYEMLKALNEKNKQEGEGAAAATGLSLSNEELLENEDFIKRFSMTCRGNLSPVCAQLGGVLGQEILKACSGKFMPILQWYYYDAFEALPDIQPSMEDVSPINCRYDGQIMIFGKVFQNKISSLNMFLVGAGAIGCEMLKNWAMMGVACSLTNISSFTNVTTSSSSSSHSGDQSNNSSSSSSSSSSNPRKEGKIIITDMDQIEKSNLSRQFLFRNTDINKPKSSTAMIAAMKMNSSLHGIALENKVATETEHIFNDDFYENLHMIVTALDNVEARLYIDQKCLFYGLPMLESGTLGAKGHTQIVAPGKTENYGATRDPPEKSIPVCTLKHFPNQIEHTLQWAREWFEEVFKQLPDDMIQYIHNSEFLIQLENQQNIKLETLQRLQESLVTQRPKSITDCVIWARHCFEDLFANRIKQLLHNFPLDRLTSSGTPFWSGSKKPPMPIDFDIHDPLHADFIISVANMRANIYHIPISNDTTNMISIAANVKVEKFRPKEDVKIASTEEELKAEKENQQRKLESASDLDRVCNDLLATLPSSSELKESSLQVSSIDFEKDHDSHMRVIASASNLRARNYKIPEADLHTSRGIAGKITPAIATTTALVTGAICMELYKLLLNKPASQLLNTFTNLAIPLFTSMEPEPPKITKSKIKGEEWKWTQVSQLIR
jgi:ubiquitin-activating enzyme E1